MTRTAVLAVCCLGAFAPQAGATSIDLPSRPAAPGGALGGVSPIFTADGGVVFGASTTPTQTTIFRVEPAAADPQPLLKLTPPDPDTFEALYARLIAAGPAGGFLLDRHQSRGLHGGVASMEQVSLMLYRVPGGPGTALPDCDWGCNDCGPSFPASIAADSASVLIAPTCGFGTPPDPMVYDIATGTTRDVPSLPVQVHIAGSYVSGTYGDGAGGGVMDWTTGKLVRTAADMGAHALLPDGTLLFTEPDSAAVLRLGPGDTEPVPIGAQGTVIDVAADRILTMTAAGTYRVWTVGGTQVAELDGILGAPAFDGRRVAFLESSCMTTRLQIWDVGSPRPDQLPARCGVPRPAGAGTMRHRTARVVLACPASEPEGCMGTAGLVAPRPGLARSFALGPGKKAAFTLATGISARRCRALVRARRWRLSISTPTVYGTATKTVNVRRSRLGGCAR